MAISQLTANMSEIGIGCAVTRTQCTPDGTSACTWGVWLNQDELRLYTKRTIEGTDTFVELPDVTITFGADGGYTLNGEPEAWLAIVEEELTLSPAMLFGSGMPTTLELMLVDLNEGTDLIVKLHAETTLALFANPERH